ncbi:MAG: hypothetical protein ABIH20_06510 [Candidatus Diapherotrites archaeon]
MDETRETIVLGVIFGLTIVAAAILSFFSGLDKLSLVDSFLFNDIIATVFSVGFIAFSLALPLPYAFLITLSLHREKEELHKIAGVGVLLAIISWIILFGISASNILLGIFFIISLKILIEIVLVKQNELNKLVTYRTASGAARTAFFIFAIGIFISSALVEINNQEQNLQKFGDTVMTFTLDNQQTLTFDTVRQQSPVIDIMAENLWLIISLGIALLFVFFSNLVLTNLTGVYTSILNTGLDVKETKPKKIEVVKEKI